MYLKDLVDIQMGQSPDSKFYNNDKIGLPFYQGKADFGRINPIPKIWCSKSKKEAKPNDILISVRAPVGDLNINNEQSCIGRGLAAITCKSDVDMMYLYYHLKYLKPQLRHISTGSTFESINRSQLENLIIDYKPYSEQIKISNILQVVQRQIEVREKLLRLYDLLIKSRFVEMFGDPVINNKKWASMNLQEISIKITSGNTPQGGSRVYINHGILFIRSQNVWNNRLELDDVVYISESFNEKMKETRLRRNDILITKTGRFNTENSSLGRCALYTGPDFQANINGHVYLVRLKSEYNPNFILSILTSEAYKNLIRSVCVGGIDKRQLNKSHIELFPIIIPPIELQNQYVHFLLKINKLKSDVQQSIDETQLLMDSLMQEYFG